MPDAERQARAILHELQDATAGKDLARLGALFDDEVVVFGSAAANLDRAASLAYLTLVVEQDAFVRWDWERIIVLAVEPTLLSFAVVGSVGYENEAGQAEGERYPFRLTCLAVQRDGGWRIRHFHGSIPSGV